MQKLLSAALVLALVLPASAQQSAPTGWARVMTLVAGAPIKVHAKSGSFGCRVKAVDDASLTCVGGDKSKTEVFQKADIGKITMSRRGRSTLAGLGIGAGIGAGVGAAVGRNGSFVPRGVSAIILAVVFGAVGAIVGVATDFTHTTIYKV